LRTVQHIVGLLRGLQMRRQRLPRVDFDRRLCNDNNSLIGDPTLELFKMQWRTACITGRDRYVVGATSIGKRSLSEHEFSLLGFL